jgi:hypothetical protein
LETYSILHIEPVPDESIFWTTAEADALEIDPPVPAIKKAAKTPPAQNGALINSVAVEARAEVGCAQPYI